MAFIDSRLVHQINANARLLPALQLRRHSYFVRESADIGVTITLETANRDFLAI
jgi:hypothetical protein